MGMNVVLSLIRQILLLDHMQRIYPVIPCQGPHASSLKKQYSFPPLNYTAIDGFDGSLYRQLVSLNRTTLNMTSRLVVNLALLGRHTDASQCEHQTFRKNYFEDPQQRVTTGCISHIRYSGSKSLRSIQGTPHDRDCSDSLNL